MIGSLNKTYWLVVHVADETGTIAFTGKRAITKHPRKLTTDDRARLADTVIANALNDDPDLFQHLTAGLQFLRTVTWCTTGESEADELIADIVSHQGAVLEIHPAQASALN